MTEKKSNKTFLLPLSLKGGKGFIPHLSFKKGGGYTLVEMLVAVAIFSLAVGTAIGIFVTAIRNQKQILIHQQLLDQTSYALEYISRALRMAKKELSAPFCLSQNGLNYEMSRGGRGIKFINYRGECQEFFWEETTRRLKESKLGQENYLTSDDLELTSFNLNLIGQSQDDTFQPRVTIFLEIQGKNLPSPPKLKIQTTISQRSLDVKY